MRLKKGLDDIMFKKEYGKDKARKDLDKSYQDYRQIQEHIGDYVNKIRRGDEEAGPDEIKDNARYAQQVLRELRMIDDRAKTENVTLQGDIRETIFHQEKLVSELSDIGKKKSKRASRQQ